MTLPPGASQALLTVAIVALIAWRLYSRIRRSIGRQRLSRVRPWITLTVFPLLIVLLALGLHGQVLGGACLAGGAVVGIGLGVYGLQLTRFEVSGEGLYYTPSAHLGIALSTLVVCRIVYRYFVSGFPAPGAPSPPPALTPLTLLLIGTLAGYYCAYAIGLLRWAARVAQTGQTAAP